MLLLWPWRGHIDDVLDISFYSGPRRYLSSSYICATSASETAIYLGISRSFYWKMLLETKPETPGDYYYRHFGSFRPFFKLSRRKAICLCYPNIYIYIYISMYICNNSYPYSIKSKSLSVSLTLIYHYIDHSCLHLIICKFHLCSEKTSHHLLSTFLNYWIPVSIDRNIRIANSYSYGKQFNQLECRAFLQFCVPSVAQPLVPISLRQASFPAFTSGAVSYICNTIWILLSLSSFFKILTTWVICQLCLHWGLLFVLFSMFWEIYNVTSLLLQYIEYFYHPQFYLLVLLCPKPFEIMDVFTLFCFTLSKSSDSWTQLTSGFFKITSFA